MMRSNGVPSEKDLPFKLGDVVLVRYSAYPYWPATVDQTHQKRYKGKFCALLRTKSGETVLCFWCTFANEDTGGWVRADRMVSFHPAILDKVRVDKKNEWHSDQKDAIESTLKAYKEMYKGVEKKVPQLPADLANASNSGVWDATDEEDIISDDESYPKLVDEDPMDLGDSDDEEEEDETPPARKGRRPSKGGKTPARPTKAKKEPRKAPKRKSPPAEEPRVTKRSKISTKREKNLLDTVDHDEEPRRKPRDTEEEVIDRSSGKRRRHSYAHPGEPSKKIRKIEAELATAKETIASLKKSLKKKEKALTELTGDGTGVACVIPPLPPPIEEPLPVEEKHRSLPVDSDKFNNMMDTLDEDYTSFKKAAETADEARTELEKTMETIKKLYNEASQKVSAAEHKATKKESDIVRDLRDILEADVQVQNLRERKAGHVVRGMLKKCKDLPAIHDFCDAIYKSWKTQVVEYMKENEGKLSQESPSGNKSSPGEKSDRKSSESPADSAKTSPKDKAKEASKSSPNEKSERKSPESPADSAKTTLKEKAKEEDNKSSTKDKSEKKPSDEGKDKDVEMKDVAAKGDDKKPEVKEGEPKKAKEGEPKKAKEGEPKKAKEGEPKKVKEEIQVKEEKQKPPTEESEVNAENTDMKNKAEKSQDVEMAEKPEKESSEKADEKDAKPDDAKREEKPSKKEASGSAAPKNSSSKAEDGDRPQAKNENK